MKVIICGAGQVGFNIAKYLASEGASVTVIDQSGELIAKISDTLDVRGIVGFASYPDVLHRAGARDADMIIAVTHADEVNMVACQVCHSLFEVPIKIARVRNQTYLDPEWVNLFSADHLPIDVVISPEIEVARAIGRRLQIPGAFDAIDLADGKLQLIGVHIQADSPIIHTPLRQLTDLFPDLHVRILGISRDGKAKIATAQDELSEGDDIYFVCETNHLARAMSAFGHEEKEARRLVIIGGGNIGLNLARSIEQRHTGVQLRIIELEKDRAEFDAQSLEKTVVIHGDALDIEILEESNVATAETVIAVTNDDEVNILASLLAKKHGARRVITLINSASYSHLIGGLGIDTVVNPRAITVSTILQHVRRGRIRSVYSLAEGVGEVMEAEALETSRLVGQPLSKANLPHGILIGAVIRENEIILPTSETVVEAGDRVVLYSLPEAVKKVEKLFAVKLEFF